ncbi:hypothetical protein PCCS19_36340 [Paenibacillus sp. CCS19]|uniref:right-handed parallel beta-helix repeat-containing protein n=1 Tax=Paenibacillus sp. CCS19 TaxID=3158387 RepID=UPI00256B8056|nr:right-handed parallel beta-helix repeat-containing protein [Paenibacillus cellulosilyticus]GMK40578.1 hypothetical protein PCCS19_36340 [Paenibacillus cellulosilyticus]
MAVQPSIILAVLVLIAIVILGAWLISRRTRRKENAGTKPVQRSGTSNMEIGVQRRKQEELVRLLPNPRQEHSLPDYLPQLSADRVIQSSMERMANMLQPYESLQEHAVKLQQIAEDAAKPLLLVVMGLFNSGKSSFINELIGMKGFLRTDDIPATAVITMLSYGKDREVVAHLLDGTQQAYPYDKLHALSSEGDDEVRKLRDAIDYLEVKLPVELLKKVTVVDTPGLNSDNEHHTKAAERFMERADQVIWLFSYEQAASRVELSKLSQLAAQWKPIGVVNFIDEHDPEEGTLDSFLTQVKRRLGGSISRLEAISTLQASQARMSGDAALRSRSGWTALERALQEELHDKAAMKKGVRQLSRIHEAITNLQSHINTEQAAYVKAYELIHDQKKAIETLENNRSKVQQIHYNWLEMKEDTALHALESNYPLPGLVNDHLKLNKQIEMLIDVLKVLDQEYTEIQRHSKNNQQNIDRHNSASEVLSKDFAEYNKSGMFGGRPLLDWDGKLKALNKRSAELDEKANQLNARAEELHTKHQLFLTRLRRNEQEGYELSRLVMAKAEESLAEFNKLLDNQEAMQAEAIEQENQLYWINSAHSMLQSLMSWELGALSAMLKQSAIGSTDTSITMMAERGLSGLHQIEQQLLHHEVITQQREAAPAVQLVDDQSEAVGVDLKSLLASLSEQEELLLEDKVYTINETILLDRSIKLRGSANGTIILAGGQLDALIRVRGENELTVESIRFDLRGSRAAVVLEGGKAVFRHCTFGGADRSTGEQDAQGGSGAALLFQGFSNGLVEGCYFVNNHIGTAWEDQSKGTIKGSRFWLNGDGVYAVGKIELTLEGNEIVRSERNGVVGKGESRISILGNRCEANRTGIYVEEGAGGYIAANDCSLNYVAGIHYDTTGQLIVEHNRCTYNGLGGIAHDAASYAEIASNECSNQMRDGIYVGGTGSVMLTANRCDHNTGCGIGVDESIKVDVRENRCDHNNYGIFVNEGSQADIVSSQFSNNRKAGIFASGQSKVSAVGCICLENQVGIGFEGQSNGIVKQCTTDQNRTTGIGFTGRSTGKADTNFARHNGDSGLSLIGEAAVELLSNECRHNAFAGIYTTDESKGTLTSNHCSLNLVGISVAGKASPSIKHNECYSNSYHGIFYSEEANGTVADNKCYDNEMNGIYVSGRSNPTLKKNELRNNKNSGIAADSESKPIISYNVMMNNVGYGIQIDDQAVPEIHSNKYDGNKCGDVSR